jgi:cytochrome d ubiquinol oxidase subunit II
MITMIQWPPLAMIILLALSAFAYMVMYGCELGVAILYPLVARPADRQLLFDSIDPFWMGAIKWVLLGPSILFLGLLIAFAAQLPVLHKPIAVMIVSLVLRGLSHKCLKRKGDLQIAWEWLFAAASMLMTLASGWALGSILEGSSLSGLPEESALLRLATIVFPMICAVGLLGAYALLGSCWLILKTEGALKIFGREVAHSALLLTILVMLVAGGWLLIVNPHAEQRVITQENWRVMGLFPIAIVLLGWHLWRSLWEIDERAPLLRGAALFGAVFLGVLCSLYPNIGPGRYTLIEVTNSPGVQRYAWAAILILLPIMVTYLWLGVRAIKGKVICYERSITSGPHIGARHTSGNPPELHLS